VVAGYGNDGASGYEGVRVGRAIGTYLHGPLLPRNPWLADLLLSWAIAHAAGGPPSLLLGPARAEIDARIARLPALQEPGDGRVQGDPVELVGTEQPVA